MIYFFLGGGTSSYISYFYLMLVIPFPSSMHVITAVCQSCQPVTLRFVLLVDKITTMISSVSNLVYHGMVAQSFFFFSLPRTLPSG